MVDNSPNSTDFFKKLLSNPPELKKVFIFVCGLNLTFFVVWLCGADGFNKLFNHFSKTTSFYFNINNDSAAKPEIGKDVWKCKLPDKDPWHTDMLSYLDSQEVGPLDKCKPIFVEMTKFEFSPSNSTLSVKDEFSKNHNCRYRCDRPLNDYEYSPDEWKELNAPVQPDCDVFEVDCSLKEAANKPVYSNLYYQIYRPPVNLTKHQESKTIFPRVSSSTTPAPTIFSKVSSSTTPAPKMSNLTQQLPQKNDLLKYKKEKKGFGVHIVVLDSVSRSNFVRSMRKTLYLLKEEFEAISFDHLNKAGLNSMPNALGFLFGRQMENIPKSPFNSEAMPPDPGYDRPTICNKHLDNETSSLFFIFKKLGYKMMMAEDWARGALNWPGCLGFKTQPTDHYMRPFQIRISELGYDKYEKSQCKEAYLTILEYFKEYVEVYKDEQEKFSLIWMSYLTHDYLNQLYHADDNFYHLFKELQSKMEDSFVFFMSDHGLRFGRHRYTDTGTMEDNNPGLFISLPKKLRRNVQLRAQMRENAKHLISHHDVYATLLAIAKSSHTWDETTWESEWNANEYLEALHGSSLFHILTKQPRDCPTLHIPFSYCQCEQKYIEIKSSAETKELINQLALACVERLNKDIAKYKYEDKCLLLSLDDAKDSVIKLEELQKIDADEEKTENATSGTFRISFQTKPGAGQFAGYLKAFYKEEKIVVREKIEIETPVKRVQSIEFISELFERLNSHGDQSACAENETLIRPYCYCKEQPVKKS